MKYKNLKGMLGAFKSMKGMIFLRLKLRDFKN